MIIRLARMYVRLRCACVGHADQLVLTPTRVYLQCELCNRTTRGWDISLMPRTVVVLPFRSKAHVA